MLICVILDFNYDGDSVIEVSEEDYDKCRASRPLFFSNNGNTLFTFDRPGLFFFISGVSGHCDRGQKIAIKVLDLEAHSAPSPQNAPQKQKGAASGLKTTSALLVVAPIIFKLFA